MSEAIPMMTLMTLMMIVVTYQGVLERHQDFEDALRV